MIEQRLIHQMASLIPCWKNDKILQVQFLKNMFLIICQPLATFRQNLVTSSPLCTEALKNRSWVFLIKYNQQALAKMINTSA